MILQTTSPSLTSTHNFLRQNHTYSVIVPACLVVLLANQTFFRLSEIFTLVGLIVSVNPTVLEMTVTACDFEGYRTKGGFGRSTTMPAVICKKIRSYGSSSTYLSLASYPVG